MTSDKNWKDVNVLVTGCTGLLGSWVTSALTRANANVVGLIRDSVPQSNLKLSGVLDSINVVFGDITNYPLLERTLNEYQISTVFHLAAQTIVGIAGQNPLSTFESNIRGTWHVLEACRRTTWVERVIVASSDKAYGEHPILPYSEESPLNGKFPYDASKVCADVLAQSYAESYQLPVCITRFGNLFGGGDLNFNRLIPGTIRGALRSEAPIIRSNGKLTRDYIYVEDAADAYITLANNMMTTPSIYGEAFNFSYGEPLDVIAIVNRILMHMDKQDLSPKILGTASNEIPHQYLDTTKAHRELNWQPTFNLDRGLARTIDWYTKWFEENVIK